MKTPLAAAIALASLYADNPTLVETSFRHLTAPALGQLDQALISHYPVSTTTYNADKDVISRECHQVIAQACIRRMVYQQLAKYQDIAAPDVVKEALEYHNLPSSLQNELIGRYGGSRPNTWGEALDRLRQLADGSKRKLWELVLDHPMTSYVPMQCHHCANILPDTMSVPGDGSDEAVGLTEVNPEEAKEECLKLRGGWFRGRPRGPKILQWTCPKCQKISQWYRSSHPQIILNPFRWGRLCGEQEDLRLALANYFGVEVRTALPVDWDHIWSEYRASREDERSEWTVKDDSARNFAARLDEGIGCWTLVLVIHPNPELCQDVTGAYLSTSSSSDHAREDTKGRADLEHEPSMPRYRKLVETARTDKAGASTQAKTMNGFAICHRASFIPDQVTHELRQAAIDFKAGRDWWDLR